MLILGRRRVAFSGRLHPVGDRLPSRPTFSVWVLPILLLMSGAARAQGLTVLPVIIQMAPGQMAAALTVINEGDKETSFQLRAFAWHQNGSEDQLSATDELLASPPLGTIAPAARQIIRLVMRHPPQGREGTYRILLDQIPPPAAPGVVRIALRLSIPIFAEPATRVAPHLLWRIESRGGQAALVAVNDGTSHLKVSDLALRASDGTVSQVEANLSPYILSGVTRRWRILNPRLSLAPGAVLRLTANSNGGAVDQQVRVDAGP
jgi:fimbrial chaperone protein